MRILHDLALPDPAFDPTGDLTDLLEALISPGRLTSRGEAHNGRATQPSTT